MWHWKVLFIFLLAILILQCESYLIRKYLVPYDFTSSRKVSKYLPNSASLIAEFEIWNANTTSNAPSSIVPFNSGYNVKKFLKSCFLPAGKLSQDYFVYSRWRALQRYISATNNVFGTQALMLALGITKRKVGTTLATTWVLKDVLGKVSRIFWASQFGKKFDENAKRWRFRSSVLYAIGNCLELLTYMFPSLFLVSAALANALKQVSMLTSSATRNTIYKSFSSGLENIGDITAKGEAQGAVIDIIGMATGILISEAIIRKRTLCFLIYSALVVADILCVFKEIRSVILKTFNIERAFLAIWPLVHGDNRSCNPRSVANNERLFFSAELDDTIIKTWSTLIISQKLMAQKAAELHDPADHFVVFVELKEHPLWWRSLSQKRTFMEPKIILTQNACSIDLLRAITIVCFCKSEYEKLDTVGGNDLDQISADILEKAYRSFRRDNGSIINNLRDNGWDINKFICSGLE